MLVLFPCATGFRAKCDYSYARTDLRGLLISPIRVPCPATIPLPLPLPIASCCLLGRFVGVSLNSTEHFRCQLQVESSRESLARCGASAG